MNLSEVLSTKTIESKIINSESLMDLRDIKLYNDSLLFFVERFTRNIYKYEIKSGETRIIGKHGRGPGEYQNPNTIILKDKSIVFSDDNTLEIQAIDFDGKYLRKYATNGHLSGRYISFDGSDNIYTANNGTHQEHYIITLSGQKYVKVPDCVKNISQMALDGGWVVENADYIYYINPYEMKIHYANINTKNEGTIILEGIPNRFDWKKYEKTKITGKKMSEIISKELDVRPLGFQKFFHKDRMYFIINVAVTKPGDKYGRRKVLIYDMNGRPIVSLLVELELPILFVEDSIWVVKGDQRGINCFVKYKMKENIIALLEK